MKSSCVGGEGASAPPKVWIAENLDKIPENPGKNGAQSCLVKMVPRDFNQFFCLLYIQAVSDVGTYTKSYIEKIHYIDAEIAGHVHKLDVKLQRLCGSGFSLFAVRILVKPYHFGVNWPTTLCQKKMGYISLPSHFNTTIGITSQYCVIL